MVATSSLQSELEKWGFTNLMRWSRGVDTKLFHPRPQIDLGLPRPIFLYVGRVSVEKNLEAFLALDLPGSKLIVGDGPAKSILERRYPDAHFAGVHVGEALAKTYSGADVFVFPSLTDTFGNVIIEALASGLPVAAFPVTGPRDIITNPDIGVLSEDLHLAAISALDLRSDVPADFAKGFSWKASADAFRRNILKGNGATGEGFSRIGSSVGVEAR